MKKLFLAMLITISMVTPVYAGQTKYRVVQPKTYDTIFVGDSRTVGLLQTVEPEDTAFICEVGQGYDWLLNKAQFDLLKIAKPGDNVIFNLGVNDTGNATNYLDLYNRLADELERKGCTVYFETVNPVSEKYNSPTNKQIDQFNEIMKTNLHSSILIIDTNAECKAWGYNTVDGLHYKKDTTQFIYDCVINSL